MISNEIMRNSDVFMRISHFLISLMKTWEKQVITISLNKHLAIKAKYVSNTWHQWNIAVHSKYNVLIKLKKFSILNRFTYFSNFEGCLTCLHLSTYLWSHYIWNFFKHTLHWSYTFSSCGKLHFFHFLEHWRVENFLLYLSLNCSFSNYCHGVSVGV